MGMEWGDQNSMPEDSPDCPSKNRLWCSNQANMRCTEAQIYWSNRGRMSFFWYRKTGPATLEEGCWWPNCFAFVLYFIQMLSKHIFSDELWLLMGILPPSDQTKCGHLNESRLKKFLWFTLKTPYQIHIQTLIFPKNFSPQTTLPGLLHLWHARNQGLGGAGQEFGEPAIGDQHLWIVYGSFGDHLRIIKNTVVLVKSCEWGVFCFWIWVTWWLIIASI